MAEPAAEEHDGHLAADQMLTQVGAQPMAVGVDLLAQCVLVRAVPVPDQG